MSSVYQGAVSIRGKDGRELPRLFEVLFVSRDNVLTLAVLQARTARQASNAIRQRFAGADVFDVVAS